MSTVQSYRQSLAADPDNAELLQGLRAVTERAEAYYIQEARRYSDAGDYGSALGLVQQGLVVVPGSAGLERERTQLQERRRAAGIFHEAAAAARLGRLERGMSLVEQSLSLDPNNQEAIALFNALNARTITTEGIAPIRLTTGAPVTVNFSNAGFKEAVLALGQAYGVNMIFDASLEDRPVTLYAEDVTFQQAFQLLLKTNSAFYRRLGRNSVVIAPDTPEGRASYEDYLVQTFYLETMNAAVAADLVSRSLGIANVTISEDSNAITVRENRERLSLVAQLLSNNDRAPAEAVLEVEILEVNRTKSEQLGLDLGSQISIAPPSTILSDLTPSSDASDTLGASVVSLPAATLRFFKQDVDAKTLANPRIRTVDNREALIHIGDRVPLRSSTIQDATGQTRTTFEYRDVGIKVNVTPEIKLDRTVVVSLELEVSSLGQNLGTADEPAFAIGTRNVSNRMVLADGETAVIGGLIRDEERDTRKSVPGLGDIPAIGKLFQTRDGSGGRTDILLTLTPRIIRGKDIPSAAESQFFSGSGDRVTTQATQDFLSSRSGDLPTIRLDLSGAATPVAATTGRPSLPSPTSNLQVPNAPATAGADAVLAFSRASYSVKADETISTSITAAGFGNAVSGTATIRFRPDLVEAVSVSTPASLPFEIDNSRGEIKLTLNDGIAGAAVKEIATVTFRGVKQGLSYLIFSSDFGAGPNVSVPEGIELRSSRIAVQ
ncbi:hypothetical protein [Yoonia sediminilitoris]|uniref:hypothetical protein n=1 Tax=Yoonia sediminilitoris TaxID=1286148 RepID=UPI001455A77A|nr:hypothetical protein [Yoonia sediminilitoris]